MSAEILERFRNLDSSILLHYAAFELQQYSPEAQGCLRTVLFERGIDETQVRAYRLQRFPFPSMDIDCAHCGAPITIERPELNEGKYTCPECNSVEAVPYPEIPIDPDDATFTGRPLSETPLPGTEAEAATAVELAHNAMSEFYGQGPNSIKLALGDAEKLDDGRLMGEELPDTTCAKCGKVLTVEETFLASDNFYCEKCYETLTPEERALFPEEEEGEEEEA
jgi:hypothetical protein